MRQDNLQGDNEYQFKFISPTSRSKRLPELIVSSVAGAEEKKLAHRDQSQRSFFLDSSLLSRVRFPPATIFKLPALFRGIHGPSLTKEK